MVNKYNENKEIKENKNIEIKLLEYEIPSKKEVDGTISINYNGRFDSISITSSIEDSSNVFTYSELDGKKINHPYSRFSILKKEIKDPHLIRFKVETNHVPNGQFSTAKFRVTLIQEHKEIASDIKFVKVMKSQ
jgi:uncharacterized alpha/beta hydrolase family protein